MEYPYEASDEASESELLDKSLSMWKGWSALDSESAFEPIPLDLHTAASIGQYDCVHAYIASSDVDINKKNKGSWTALMYACYIGHDTIVNLLLDAKAKVDLRSDKGSTALMMAASCGNESVAYFLLQEGAELEIVDHRGWTALFYATYNGHQSMVQFLLENGAQPNAREPSLGITPLMMAAAEGHEIIVNFLLGTKGVDIDLKNQRGDTARSLALLNGHMKIVSLIDNRSMSPSSVRSAPGLGDDLDLSSSDENFQMPSSRPSFQQHHHHHHHLKGRGSKAKGPSILDGPEAFAKMLGEKKAKPPDLHSKDHSELREDGGEGEDTAFCVSGALTIRSSNSSCSSSSGGGLAGALGVSCDASLSSNEDSSLSRSDLMDGKNPRTHQGVDPNDLVAGISKIGLTQTQQGRTEEYVNQLQQHQSHQQLHVGWNLGANLQIYPSDHGPHHPTPHQPTTFNPPPAIGYTSTVHPLQGSDPSPKDQADEVDPPKARYPFNDLRELLESLGLIKYLHIFEEQEIDLRVFLTLTDCDLKEVGIKLMGPRRKLTNAIARWHSQAVPFSNTLEQVYADRVETAMQEMAIQLSEDSMKKEQLEAQVLQEKELRSVVEGCLMEDKKVYQQMVSMVTDTSKLCHRMRQLYDNMRCYQVELVRRVQSMPLLSRRESDSGMSSDGRGGSSPSSDIVRSIMSSPVLRGTAVSSTHPNEPMGFPIRDGHRHTSIDQALSLDNENGELRKLPMVDLVETLGQLSHKLGRIVAMVTNNMDKIVDGQSAFSPNSSGNSLP
ncbi:ankyrin repeat and SAM domain-containing protein 3-like isoform X1 [Lytechinus variegatus]|uniref:ankyrin repeat and SAM domain-containing protein 3-like isoform X1 n=1 Tax=Lytechinus variegatus TaxID=7654 RepID=UPI001BB28008|nr:ankyrin repeat and SAM domain-containing protein 3-like isoform X1 [Lytechinus variegatus]